MSQAAGGVSASRAYSGNEYLKQYQQRMNSNSPGSNNVPASSEKLNGFSMTQHIMPNSLKVSNRK